MLGVYRTLLRLAEVLLKKSGCREDKKIHSKCLGCCVFLGRYMAVSCREPVPEECMFESERMGLPER